LPLGNNIESTVAESTKNTYKTSWEHQWENKVVYEKGIVSRIDDLTHKIDGIHRSDNQTVETSEELNK